ncbi:hypothetical protein RVR_9031 [Actinacidiphila reveromycinica]|uniref:Uncharacterized protein n=1 Tax=Actinacidiphila reveromycinica TaxID=659352 RepID=A0A7U3VSA9_9ACTN|nr:hypothetical protein RVR_9031 [Streptomyces sp. SN-593]
MVHNVTSATRLLDVLPLFRDDLRVQLLATCTGSSPFRAGIGELLDAVGVPVLPWDQALATPVDLAVSASFGGQLDLLRGKLAILSHGVGYNKTLRTGNAVFGLSREWLLAGGAPVADAMVLSHPEQLDRLADACPEALPTAVLGGDPCYDRILAAESHRPRYRRALGVRPGQRLVLLNSTWNPTALFGDAGTEDVLPLLLPRLASELPVDEYRVAAVLHPNIWAAHGAGQVRLWLDRARRAGLTLVDPLTAWRQALIAADLVIGDFGSVSYYAAARGTPVLLGSASLAALGHGTPVADFVRAAPRLDPHAPLLPQLERLLDGHRPMHGPATLTTSVPGRSARLLRGLFYRLIGIPEPPSPALLDPLPLPPFEAQRTTAPLRVVVHRDAGGALAVHRYAAPPREPDGPGEGHLAVHEDTLDPGALDLADLIYRHGALDDPRFGTPREWTAEVLARHPSCTMAAYVIGRRTCVVRHRNGLLAALGTLSRPEREGVAPAGEGAGGPDPALYASALLGLLEESGGALPAGGFTVRTGPERRPSASGPGGDAAPPSGTDVFEVDARVLAAEGNRCAVDIGRSGSGPPGGGG